MQETKEQISTNGIQQNKEQQNTINEVLNKKILKLSQEFLDKIEFKEKNYEQLKAEEREKQRIAYKRAMAQATAKFPVIMTNKTITKKDGTTYNYPDLKSMVEPTKPILAKYGFYVEFRFRTNIQSKTISTIMVISHEDGFSNASEPFELKVNTDDPQSIASALTYSKRYLYSSMLNLNVENDDDGSLASGRIENKITDKPNKIQTEQKPQDYKTNKPKQEIIQSNQSNQIPALEKAKCADCGKEISEEEKLYSIRNFNNPYCLDCQSNH